MLYRLFTENKRKKWICELIAEKFSGFTVFETIGYWQGKKEKGLCIEILTDNLMDSIFINQICKAICSYNKQDCVMVQKIKAKNFFVDIVGIK